MYFIGLDLAWSPKNGSGIAILEGGKNRAELIASGIVYSDSDIVDYINRHVSNNPAFIAIDAPLIVPNETGRRHVEALVGNLFRKYDAGAHPSNRQRLAQWSGTIRGEEISKLLEKEKYTHDPEIKQYEEKRKFFEVFPHPSMVVLFQMNKILQYKAKPHRDYDFRWGEFKKYQNYLKELANKKPAVIIPKKVTSQNVKKLKSQALKDYEDLLDGIFCAYIAYYAWCNPEKCEILGDMNKGYILTPITESMQKQLKEIKSQSSLTAFG
jgi:predicted RNase H-like nuclease